MCGIIGILGKDNVSSRVVVGLKRLEYRGYDSSGIATLDHGQLDRRRAAGKLVNLEARLETSPLAGTTGIGHTRWATHGAATDNNAHPHATDRVAIVHNGIIETFSELRAELIANGRTFGSQTDSEVCAQLITQYLEEDNSAPIDAVSKALKRLQGAFALAVIFTGEEDLMIAARRGSPLAIGRGDGEMFLGSDAYALAPFTNRITYMDEGDLAVVTRTKIQIFDADGAPVTRAEVISSAADSLVDKDGHRHFMSKEIHEQPEVIAHTLSRYIDGSTGEITLPEGAFNFKGLSRLTISACGTAFIAGQIAKYWFESWARIPIEIDIASELRYRDVPYQENGAALFISQSGETADTLAALRDAKQKGQKIASVVNVSESSIARESDIVFPMAAGPEIGVASTKAFTCQLAVLAVMALAAGRDRGHLSNDDVSAIVIDLLKTPRLVGEAIKQADAIEKIALDLSKADNALYLGRGLCFPLAMEGALKLKEISYIHAEGYAAGELKHGPIALIDEEMPIIVIAPSDKHFEKTISNMHEVLARDGKAIFISDKQGLAKAGDSVMAKILVPDVSPMMAPIVYAAPIQLLAYYTARAKGTDVDQPRNLAKSVTVE